MEKLKLSELQKFQLLNDAFNNITSQGKNSYYQFLHPYDCDRVKFICGAFSKKNGARVEVVYSCNFCTVRLLWHYVNMPIFGGLSNEFIFVPKAITIEREFKGSILISIVPDPDAKGVYIYQHIKSIFELCEGDSEGEDAEDAHAGACLAEVDDDSTHSKKNENVTL